MVITLAIRLQEGCLRSSYPIIKSMISPNSYSTVILDLISIQRNDCLLIVIAYVRLTRHDDLKQMLDSAKDGPKLEAMKRIIGVSL